MKAIGLTEFGGPEVLHVVELPTPVPSREEIRIRVEAVAVNPTDVTFRSGGRAAQLAERVPPYIPGMDVAGVVNEVGAGSDGRLSVGDRVVAYVIPFEPHGGTYAQQVVVTQASVVRAPEDATFAEASTLLLNAVTAHLALDALHLTAGQTVAISGAAGAVGGFAIELAKARDLTVIAAVSKDDTDLVRSLGADHVLERGAGLVESIRGLVPSGVDGFVDGANLGAAALPAIADNGSLATLTGRSGPTERGITITPISSFGSSTDTALFDELRGLAENGTLTLRVADVLPAEQAANAHRRLAAGGTRGRLVLDFSSL